MPKRVFPQDSLDYVEQNYHALVLPRFPRYATFWEEFIGGSFSAPEGRLIPYPVRFAAATSASQQAWVQEVRNTVAIAHYTLFTHLAAAHLLLARLPARATTQQELFECMLVVEDLYFRLGNAWFCYRDSLGASCHQMAHGGTREQQRQPFHKLMQSDAAIGPLLQRFEAGALLMRNNLVHYGRFAVLWHGTDILVPLPISANPPWQYVVQAHEFENVRELAASHLSETERLFNAMHAEVTRLLRSGLTANGATVDHT